jgi:hypothetical protein
LLPDMTHGLRTTDFRPIVEEESNHGLWVNSK